MRTIDQLFKDLKNEKIKIWLDGSQLRYRAPKGSLQPALRKELVERKEEIISSIQQEVAIPELVADTINRYQAFPLTEIQQAYWVGRSGAYDLGEVGVHGYLEIESDFNIDKLNASWNAVIQRHEMLRAIVMSNGEQKIIENVPDYKIKLTDMSTASKADAEKHLKTIYNEMSHQVLAADSWPLFDIRATRLKDNKVRLHVSLDLLMADLWSLFIVFQDWADFIEDEDYSPEPLDVSFRDYVLAEQEFRKSNTYKMAEQYWLDRIDSLPLGPDLPLHNSTETLQHVNFTRHASKLDKATWSALKEKAKKYGLTSSGVLFSAYSEILGRWSRSADFNLNLTLFNRLPVHPQINRVVGDFTTTLLLAIDHSKRETFVERAKRLQQQLFNDLDNRSVNAVQVIREMARHQGGLPRAAMPVVFSSALGIDSLDEGSPGLGQFGAQLGEVICTISQTPQVWIDHQAVEEQGALLFNWDGVEDLFPENMLADMFSSYCSLLSKLAKNNDFWQTSDRNLLPDTQQQQREQVNNTESDVSEKLLHQLFVEQCAKNPDKTAVVSATKTLTYTELLERAAQIANRLKNVEVKPNTLVAIVMEKGWEQVAASLGILMSGAAYVPIDPELPDERRFSLFDSADIKIVLTQSSINRRIAWPDSTDEKLLCLNVDDDKIWASESTEPLLNEQSKTDLAYVIFTSGSTGMPKGVMIDHRGAVNTILDINQRYSINETDSVLALSALSFDLSVYDIFGLLAAGGTIVLPNAQGNKDTAQWVELMIEHNVTLWNTVPALLHMLVEHIAGDKTKCCDTLKITMLSGDWIPITLPEKVKLLWPNNQLISQGGATEASIWSIYYPVESVDKGWTSIPYGKPLKNQSYHVLNAALEDCPVWVTGQLYIGGIGVAQGYWKDTEKTNASFIIHPKTKQRLYKTGDLGRYLDDGNIEFLGREDFQVKVNGYRIELGEIEAALQQHPDIQSSVVTTVGETREAKRLVAYVVTASNNKDKLKNNLKPPAVDLNSLDKLQFKLDQKSIRNIEPQQTCVKLFKPELDKNLKDQYLRHRSYREYFQSPIASEPFGDFMASLQNIPLDESPLPKYRYPSAGSLYPVQTYLYVKPGRIEGVQGGVYYYHPTEHGLVLIANSPEIDAKVEQAYGGMNAEIFEQAAFALFSIGELDAIEPLYGEWAKDFCYLEAGYIGQLLMNRAPDYKIGLCPIGKVELDVLRTVFEWQPSQIFVQGFLGGGITQTQIEQLSFPKAKKKSAATENPNLTNLSEKDLRTYLHTKLPEHMVPAHCIFIDGLPLTANGKLDRKALPKLEQSGNQKNRIPETMPTSDIEKKIAELIKQVLKIEQVGMNDNLFDLGADSVAIVRLNNLLVETFKTEIPVVEMFQYPTASYLTSFLKETDGNKSSTTAAWSRAEKIRQARSKRAGA
ncbi:Polyketide synthase modules and related proteins [hydrothermal vent metagenome]|uniref:Polyketide synthase modules and related proteins n=1 Tax=hydrothermal vent metagenome TaxID=652676 RepID=A0A3B1AVB5_9ZZZZ